MAAAGLLSRYDLSSTFEDLSDMIYNVDPVDTMFMQMAKREKSENIMKEWNVDELSDVITTPAADGADFSGDTLSSAEKRNNYHEILRRDIIVSRRADIVNKPGRRSEVAYQIMKEMKTLKNSVETSCLTRKLPALGSEGTGGVTAGVPVWLETNASLGSSASVPAIANGRPSVDGKGGTASSPDRDPYSAGEAGRVQQQHGQGQLAASFACAEAEPFGLPVLQLGCKDC